MNISSYDIFHVHTYRCGHAENVPDESYIKKAISEGASGIWFTDHVPFPGDPFGGRMKYSELNEYLSTLSELKAKYAEIIDVHIGFEAEYFPSFDSSGYYKELKVNPNIELLLLGQHMAETSPGKYTFSWNKKKLDKEEYLILGDAEIRGIKSGYFDVIAHPDRIFRRKTSWSADMQLIAENIIHTAQDCKVLLEQNESSKHHIHHYWPEFWNIVNDEFIVSGLDAHSLNEIQLKLSVPIGTGFSLLIWSTPP